MEQAGPSWVKYFDTAISMGMTLEEAKDYCKEFNGSEKSEAMEKLKLFKK